MSDVSDFDFTGIRVETEVDATTSAEAGVPFKYLRRTEVRWKSACVEKARIILHTVALRRDPRSPRWHGAADVAPFLGRQVKSNQFRHDGLKQMGEVDEMTFNLRAKNKVGENGMAPLPQRAGIAARPESLAVSITDWSGVTGAGKLIDLFGCLGERFIGQQLMETDRDLIVIPLGVRREPDGYPIGNGTQNQGVPFPCRESEFLASEKSIFDVISNFVQKRHPGR